jgi:GT2 family glycosyltransferase
MSLSARRGADEGSAKVTKARVSIVIPVFARQRQLDHALASLASEAEHIHDVTVVDDASPDPIVVHAPDALAGRTKIVRLGENVGPSAARQIGVDHGVGEWVAFLDSDDAWLPGKLAAQLALIKEDQPLLAVTCGFGVVDPKRNAYYQRTPVSADRVADFASGCWFCPGSTALVSRKAFEIVGPFDPALRRLEDLDWFLRLALAGGRLVVADMAGALILRGTTRNRPVVEAAAAHLAAKFAEPANVRHALRAWLDVERAAAAYADGDVISATGLVLRSIVRQPRLQLQMREWWRMGAAPLEPDAAHRALGISREV